MTRSPSSASAERPIRTDHREGRLIDLAVYEMLLVPASGDIKATPTVPYTPNSRRSDWLEKPKMARWPPNRTGAAPKTAETPIFGASV